VLIAKRRHEIMTEKDWKQEIYHLVDEAIIMSPTIWKKKGDWDYRITKSLLRDLLNELMDKLNLADAHYERRIKGIKEHFRKELENENANCVAVCVDYDVLVCQKDEEITRLKAENLELLREISLGKKYREATKP